MSKRISKSGLASLVLLGLVSVPASGGDRVLKDGDLKNLGKRLTTFIQASINKKDIGEAQEDVAGELAKLQKRLKGRDPLSSTADVGYALWLSNNYAKARVKKGKVTDVSHEHDLFEDGLEYAVWTPSGYSAKQSYPLILSIPDEGITPHTDLTERWVSKEVRDSAIVAAASMPEDHAAWSVADSGGTPGGIAHVLITLKAISESYAIDFDRVYLAGRGSGVAAAVAIAEKFPDRFAGVVGQAGDAGETSAVNFRNLPTYFAGGGGRVTAFNSAVQEAGYDNCTVEQEGRELDIWNWIQEHPRVSNPTEVTLVPGAPFPVRAYWVQVVPSDGQTAARVDARVDRDTNTIEVSATGVPSVTLYFNDDIVDLEKPIRVLCNGAEHVDTVPRSLKTFLDLVFTSRCDPGKVYVAYKGYDVPVSAKEE